MSNLYDILETCLQEIEQGADIDTVLFHHPEHADELRPILEASLMAKGNAVPAPSADVVRRNRAKVLQHAAQMREEQVRPSRRLWSVPLRRALATLVIIAALFSTGTGLVGAASTTLPGDNLYPVKRTWEDMLILFTFNPQSREVLEVEHENERLDELKELFAEGRSTRVDFSGLVTRQNGDLWLVSGIPVAVSAQTGLPVQSIAVGDAVHVVGITQKDGAVLAQKIDLLPAGMPLPAVTDDDSYEVEGENSGSSDQTGEDNSGKGSGSEAPKAEDTKTPDSNSGSSSESEPKQQSIKGVVESINGSILIINGQIANIRSAEIKGTPQVGASVKVEGYYDANGLFIVTKIEFEGSGSGGGSDSSIDGSDDNGDDNSGDDHSNNDNGGDDNSNDSGNDNSGSGGGD